MNTPTCVVPLDAEPLDCCVCPNSGLLAAGLVTGALQLASFSCPASINGTSQLSYQLRHTVPPPANAPAAAASKKKKKPATATSIATSGGGDGSSAAADGADAPSCRAVAFTHAGDAVLAGYSDNVVRLYDAAAGKLTAVFSGEHDAQLSRVFAVGPNLFASGDEDGLVVLWDTRVGAAGGGGGSRGGAGGGGGSGALYRYTQHTDYITDFALQDREQALVVTSGDATLSVHDLRKRKALARSEDDGDDELLSCCVVKGGKKVVAGTQSGVLHLYSWGYWNDCSDRFPGHPESVQALVAFDQDTVLTGSSDGGVRVVGVLPNRLLGILGQHHEDFPVERLALSHDRRVLASTSHDSAVKLWDLSILHDEDGEGEDEEEGGGEGEEEEAARAEGGLSKARGEAGGVADGGDSDGGTEDGSEDSDFSDEDEDEEGDGSSDGEGETEEGHSGGGEEENADGREAEGSGRGDAGQAGEGADGAGPSAPNQVVGGSCVGKKGREAKGAGKAALGARGRKEGDEKAGGKGVGAGDGGSDGEDGGGGDGGGSGSDDSDSSGGGDGGRQRKRAKRERTKWTKGAEQRKQPTGNFFADLL